MDNLCHTLVGSALGHAGLGRRSRFGQATLMLAANIPDLDVLVFATGVPAVSFRRGWTHGLAAQLTLPIVLTLALAAVGRWRERREPSAPGGSAAPIRPAWLLVLSYAGVGSHVLLDYLNTYGIRLLAPFDWRWFYGDAVFIIDVWLWILLGAGVWYARRRAAAAPARLALAAAAVYIGAMLLTAGWAESFVREAWQARSGRAPAALMAGPVPVTPHRREVIVDAGEYYVSGVLSWRGELVLDPAVVPKNARLPEVARARREPDVRGFLVWSRFPYWQIERDVGHTRVTVRDMRFGDRFAATATLPD